MYLQSRNRAGLAMLTVAVLASGCSVQRFAANRIGDTLAAALDERCAAHQEERHVRADRDRD